MSSNGQKNKNGKDILELGEKGNLSLILRIKDVGSGKSHLKTDDGAAKFYCCKYESGGKTDNYSYQDFCNQKYDKGRRSKRNFGDVTLH